MKLTFIFIGIIAVLLIVIYFLYKSFKSVKEQNKSLIEQIEKQQKNILYLYKHAQEIAVIEKDRIKTDEKIKEAKSDEEILDIINAIIAVNNDRMHNSSEDEDCASAETNKRRKTGSNKS